MDGEEIGVDVDGRDGGVFVPVEADGLAAGVVADDVADFVGFSPTAVGAGHVLAIDEDLNRVIFLFKFVGALQFLVNNTVDGGTRAIVGRDDQGSGWVFEVFVGDCGEAIGFVGDFGDAALGLEHGDSFRDAAFGEVFDNLFEGLVVLADDAVEACCADALFLELSEGSAGVHGFMLADVADEDYAVCGCKAGEEFIDLLGAGKRGFIDEVDGGLLVRLLWGGEVHLQGGAFRATLGELGGGA